MKRKGSRPSHNRTPRSNAPRGRPATRMPTKQGGNTPKPRPAATTATAAASVPFWKRKAFLWLGGLFTVVLAGVLQNVLTPQAQRIIPPPSSPSPIRSSGPPLTVVSEDPVGQSTFDWVFPNR